MVRRACRQVGFSLLEIMVVIMIIGLAMTMVGLSVTQGGAKDDIWNNIEKLLGMAQYANEHAILTGDTVGLRVEPPEWRAQRGELIEDYGWRFEWVVLSDEGWNPLAVMPAIELPPSVRLVVEVDEQIWKYEAQVDRTTPLVAFYSSGDMSDIAIEFSDSREPGFVQHIEVDETGELVWLEAPEPPKVDKNAF